MACSFCNREIPKGSAYIFAKKDGTTVSFCSSKCKSNQLGLKRVGKKAPWVKRRKSASSTKKAKKK
jgi:ribosomal protein L24E